MSTRYGIRRSSTRSWLSRKWVTVDEHSIPKWVSRKKDAMCYGSKEEALADILRFDLDDEHQPWEVGDPETPRLLIEEL